MEKRTMHFFGDNVNDKEGALSTKLAGSVSLTTEFLTIGKTTGIRVVAGEVNYYGKIDALASKNIIFTEDQLRIPVDEKYNFEDKLVELYSTHLEEWKLANKITDFVDVELKNITGGGGAHNAAYDAQTYINGSPNVPLEVRLVVPYGSDAIKNKLPPKLIYDPIFGIDESMVPANLNIALPYGKKITLRSKVSMPGQYKSLNKYIKNNDIIIMDSIKDPQYVYEINKLIQNNKTLEFYLGATDSMIKALGKSSTYDLALASDLFVSNSTEFNELIGKPVSNDHDLIMALEDLQTEQLNKHGKIGTICITYGESGAVICDESKRVYFQTVAAPLIRTPYANPTPIVNTNGCGDAFFAIATIGKAMGNMSNSILNYANAAGHICAFTPAATGPQMATLADIQTYRENFGHSPICGYNAKKKSFEPTGL